ncbi:hypothetical protein BG011_001049 [Mortierella polycephala]|uniref:Uncharacterized protein n=1 Tax=Mortierella polycephala TaxID=41804 RepID=A0A9P6TV02_9FUNG|nr:hypothetical protein BG011_001049 [Mortierella polycephala]
MGFLVYDVPDAVRTLSINRPRLTVLGVVTRNDYNRNIHSLGSAINFSIIKALQEVATIPALPPTLLPTTVPDSHPALPRARIPRHRARHSFKQRTRLKQLEPPENMKQYAWKAWKKKLEDPLDRNNDAPKNNGNKQDNKQNKK